jgi:hypothetical protein
MSQCVSCPSAGHVLVSRCANASEQARYVDFRSGAPRGSELSCRVCQGSTERASCSHRDAGPRHRVPDGRSERPLRQRHLWHPPQPVQTYAERPRRRGETVAPMVGHSDEPGRGRRGNERFWIIPGEGAAVRADTSRRFLPVHVPCRRIDVREQAFGARLLREQQAATDLLKTPNRSHGPSFRNVPRACYGSSRVQSVHSPAACFSWIA